jgi:uncharacterized protein YjcR
MPAPKGNQNAKGNRTPKTGRRDRFKPEYCRIAEAMCKLGALDRDIADELGISIRTFYNWKAEHVDFAAAIKRGKEVADKAVEDALYRNAVGHYYEEEETHVVGNGPHAVLQTITVKKLHKPETAAQSLWLRNRRPAEWRN